MAANNIYEEDAIYEEEDALSPELLSELADKLDAKKEGKKPRFIYTEADFSPLESVCVPPPVRFPDRIEWVDELVRRHSPRQFVLAYTFEGPKSIALFMKRHVLPGRALFDPGASKGLQWHIFGPRGWEPDYGGESRVLALIEVARQVYIRHAIEIVRVSAEIARYIETLDPRQAADEREAKEQELAENEDFRKILYECIKHHFVHDNAINSIIRYLKTGETVDGTDESVTFTGSWDEIGKRCLVPYADGIFDVEHESFRRYTPQDFFLKKAPFQFDPSAQCPLWEKTLSEIFRGEGDVVEWIHIYLGYVLLRLCTEHICVFFYGQRGRNGKSLIANLLMQALGELATSIPASTLMADAKQNRNSAAPDALLMRGRALCILSEFDEYAKLNAPFLKAMTGQDQIQGRALYSPKIETFFPTHNFVVLTNYRPRADAQDEALWRRIILVPFTAVYCREPKEEGEFPLDAQLEQKLQDELPGILAWLTLGAIKYVRGGKRLPPLPPTIARATAEYRAEEDAIQAFLDDCAITPAEPDAEERTSYAYAVFRRWCKSVGGYSMVPSDRTFKERLLKKGVEFKRGKSRVYRGLQLKPEAELAEIIGTDDDL